ncbi:MAG: hypothetical protein ACE5HE_07005 [Phycisphaerae bacterium]
MARTKIRIKDLAAEFGVTSRQVIDRCRAEGLSVQNSISRLPRDQERLVRSWFGHLGTDEAGDDVIRDTGQA